MYTPEIMRENLLMGTTDQVIERLKKYEQLGYNEFSYWIDSGMDYDMKMASLEHFIKKVIPAIQS